MYCFPVVCLQETQESLSEMRASPALYTGTERQRGVGGVDGGLRPDGASQTATFRAAKLARTLH